MARLTLQRHWRAQRRAARARGLAHVGQNNAAAGERKTPDKSTQQRAAFRPQPREPRSKGRRIKRDPPHVQRGFDGRLLANSSAAG